MTTTHTYSYRPVGQWERPIVFQDDERIAAAHNTNEAHAIVTMLEQEQRERQQRERGETPEPRPRVIAGQHVNTDANTQPESWHYRGAPSVIIIDAANPDHWKYVDNFVRNAPEYRVDIESARVPAFSFGYHIGYYPQDQDDDGGDLVGDGPYCAACIDPINGYAEPNPSAPEDFPQFFHAEIVTEGDEDGDGNPIPRYCAGCHEPLYEPSEEN